MKNRSKLNIIQIHLDTPPKSWSYLKIIHCWKILISKLIHFMNTFSRSLNAVLSFIQKKKSAFLYIMKEVHWVQKRAAVIIRGPDPLAFSDRHIWWHFHWHTWLELPISAESRETSSKTVKMMLEKDAASLVHLHTN